MKSKTKKQNKRPAKSKVRHYSEHHLGLILIAVLLIEGFLMTSTTKADWESASKVLDMSVAIESSAAQLSALAQPVIDLADSVNQFYVLAAVQATPLLDMGPAMISLGMIYDGVTQFYDQAAVQLAQLLDVSTFTSWPSQVAGVSITAQ